MVRFGALLPSRLYVVGFKMIPFYETSVMVQVIYDQVQKGNADRVYIQSAIE